ncbi:MAG: tetratricopeptide repeat protein [Alphaproteobacteria bacterium]
MFKFIKNLVSKDQSLQTDGFAADGNAALSTGNKHFTVLIAQLEGDADGAQTRHIAESLENLFSQSGKNDAPQLRVARYPKALKLGRAEVSGAVAKAEAKGQTGLARQNADVMVWGCVSTADNVLRLRFLPRERAGTSSENSSVSAKRYRLNEVIELPLNFPADWGAAITVLAMAGIEPAYKDTDHTLADVNEPLVEILASLATNIPATVADETKAVIWYAYALGEQMLGEERGDTSRLETAITSYRKALSGWTRDKAPLTWAMAQNSLGNTLIALGERDGNPARLNQAVVSYREALKERVRERVPLDWAATQNNLGAVLMTLGGLEGNPARYEEAAAAYRSSLEERSREQAPFLWALAQKKLGAALLRLGERETRTKRLEEAVKVFRDALEELPRSRVPQLWAATQNNLGAALRLLGERENSTLRLEEAVTAFRASLVENTRERAPLDWATAQNNLGNALLTLGEHESNTVHLEEAASAFNAALEEHKRERAPLDWAMTQHNLGRALAMLGMREGGTERFTEAVTAFHSALEEQSDERTPVDWAATQYFLGITQAALGERQAETDQPAACASLGQARAAYLAALGQFVRTGDNQREDDIRRKVGELAKLTAQLGCGG